MTRPRRPGAEALPGGPADAADLHEQAGRHAVEGGDRLRRLPKILHLPGEHADLLCTQKLLIRTDRGRLKAVPRAAAQARSPAAGRTPIAAPITLQRVHTYWRVHEFEISGRQFSGFQRLVLNALKCFVTHFGTKCVPSRNSYASAASHHGVLSPVQCGGLLLFVLRA